MGGTGVSPGLLFFMLINFKMLIMLNTGQWEEHVMVQVLLLGGDF